MNIYIPVEVKVRELEGKTLLALAAAERGHTVVLGGKEDTLAFARRGTLKPGIFHEKSLTPSSGKLAALRELRARGHVITSQDEEHGLLDVSYEPFARLRYSKETYSIASRVLCWGAHDARGVRDLYGQEDSSTVVETGSPRVDLWRREFTEYYARNRDSLTDEAGHYVLVSSNLGTVLGVRPFWQLIDSLREKHRGRVQQPVVAELEYSILRKAGWLMCLLSEYVRMIRTLAAAEPGMRVVVRPHPVEVVEGWRVLIGDCPNVVVTREGPLSRWIRGAKVVIHNGCTSGFEAAVCGVPVIAYMPIRSEFERTVPNSVSYQTKSLGALLEAVRSVSNGGSLGVDPRRRMEEAAVLRERFANLDGPLAVDRIVDQWEQLSTASLKQANDWAGLRRAMLGRRLRSGVGWAFSRVRPRRTSRWQSVSKHKYPGLSDTEMRTNVDNFKSSLGRFDGVVHERLGRRSFIIRPK